MSDCRTSMKPCNNCRWMLIKEGDPCNDCYSDDDKWEPIYCMAIRGEERA